MNVGPRGTSSIRPEKAQIDPAKAKTPGAAAIASGTAAAGRAVPRYRSGFWYRLRSAVGPIWPDMAGTLGRVICRFRASEFYASSPLSQPYSVCHGGRGNAAGERR